MKAVDFRNQTFEGIRARLGGLRREVYAGLVVHGPCTTRELARLTGIDILTVRPRVTELCLIYGLARCVSGHDGEGIYAAVPGAEWESWAQGSL